jgi:hypothetical protein
MRTESNQSIGALMHRPRGVLRERQYLNGESERPTVADAGRGAIWVRSIHAAYLFASSSHARVRTASAIRYRCSSPCIENAYAPDRRAGKSSGPSPKARGARQDCGRGGYDQRDHGAPH